MKQVRLADYIKHNKKHYAMSIYFEAIFPEKFVEILECFSRLEEPGRPPYMYCLFSFYWSNTDERFEHGVMFSIGFAGKNREDFEQVVSYKSFLKYIKKVSKIYIRLFPEEKKEVKRLLHLTKTKLKPYL